MKHPDIVAKEGMWLTNGETFSKAVYLGNNDTRDKWYEITDNEYREILRKREILRHQEASGTPYIDFLDI